METTVHHRIDTDLLPAVQALEKRIGHTPLHAVTHLFQRRNVQLFAKKEWMQLSGSVKARAAYQIIRKAIESGELNRQTTLLDATSGNTGIAYAHIARLLNIPVALCLPENASRERKDILQSLGVRLILTSRFEGTDGAQQTAKAMALENPSAYFYADQYKNPNNWKAHYHTTAPEIFSALPGITHFVAGLGTTGTFTGTGRRLRELNPSIRLISLQPDSALHGLEGWKHMETAIVPRIYDPTLADANYEVSTEEAYEMMRAAHRHEGLLLSPSSAANLAAAIKVGEQLESGIVVTVFPDNADKYGEVIQKVL
ncbi:MAG: cysteine synthase family protein [Bacteroidota bacterium]|nr:cysteine synthase family protein [Bacteroidota bacterium]MDP4214768.1 cysteine synthase family protein [Bacteroidota bacterium]MDP4245664.1 cysteine synthase family protein [Bacteroidota bacterium]MDP4255897.1 cysteine synthase family protein [Bacteroidota bacterium]MDP4256853.1 cysteine synthase family protein [Bacteroidota bacterium]